MLVRWPSRATNQSFGSSMRCQLAALFLLGFLVAATAAPPQMAARTLRQVVAPTWLLGPTVPPSAQAARVEVTQQNLRQAAAWRAMIQKAVSENTYAVAASPPPQEYMSSLGGGVPAPLFPAWNFTISFPRSGWGQPPSAA